MAKTSKFSMVWDYRPEIHQSPHSTADTKAAALSKKGSEQKTVGNHKELAFVFLKNSDQSQTQPVSPVYRPYPALREKIVHRSTVSGIARLSISQRIMQRDFQVWVEIKIAAEVNDLLFSGE